MINKKQRAKLKKKLSELGIVEYNLYPTFNGYKLVIVDFKIRLDLKLGEAGLTKKYMESLINEIKKNIRGE